MIRPLINRSLTIAPIALIGIVLVGMGGNFQEAWGVGLNYVDANDFTNLSPPEAIDSFGTMAEPDNLWDVRTDFGLGLTVFQSSGENSPELTQRITGLTPNKNYDVYGVFQTDDDENWTLRTGLESGNLTLYSFWGNRGPAPVVNSTPGIAAGAAVWDTLPPTNKEGTVFTERPADTLVVLLGKAGTVMANGAGEIDVFLDDLMGSMAGSQRTWLEGVAYTDAGTQIALNATLDRSSGAITITNPTTTPFQIKSISLVSTAGGLDATSWTTIAGWDTTATPDPTAEFATDLTQSDPAMTGTTIAANGGSLSFGNVWNPSRFEDVLIRLTRTDDEIAVMVPQYSGPQIIAGDFDGNGVINLSDFQLLLANLHTDVSALALAEAFQRGDMNGDRTINFTDFQTFRDAYDAQNGAGAFAELAAQVPEPSTVALLLIAVAVCVGRAPRRLTGLGLALVTCLLAVNSASAIDLLKVDVDARAGDPNGAPPGDNTVAGFLSYTMMGAGGQGMTTGMVGGYTITLTAVDAFGTPMGMFDDRDRATPTTAPTLNQLYDDFIFANVGTTGEGGGFDMAINSGGALMPNTDYTVSIFSFDTGSTGNRTADWLDGNAGNALVFQTMFDGIAANSPTSDDQYKFGGAFRTDGSGNLLLRARETSAASHGVFLNGFIISDDEPPPPPVELTLRVNTTTGAVSIVNEQTTSFDMSYYEIRSASGALNPAGWMSLDDAEGGDPVGTGWDEAAASNVSILSEVNLTSMRTFNPGDSTSLGAAFSPGGANDLRFFYAGPDETVLRSGIIAFVTGPSGVPGDYNGNNVVDAADYVVWRKNLGSTNTLPNDETPGMVTQEDYTVWRSNFGRTAGAGASLSAAAVPEPHSMLFVLWAAMGVLWLRRREV